MKSLGEPILHLILERSTQLLLLVAQNIISRYWLVLVTFIVGSENLVVYQDTS